MKFYPSLSEIGTVSGINGIRFYTCTRGLGKQYGKKQTKVFGRKSIFHNGTDFCNFSSFSCSLETPDSPYLHCSALFLFRITVNSLCDIQNETNMKQNSAIIFKRRTLQLPTSTDRVYAANSELRFKLGRALRESREREGYRDLPSKIFPE